MLAFTLLALSCPTPNAEHILAKNSNGHTVRWEFSSSQVLSIPSAVELGYRNWVRKNTSLSGRELLQNHIQIVEKVYEPQEILKMRKIVAGEIGKFPG